MRQLPGASEAQDPRLAFLDIVRAGGEFPDPAQALFGANPHKFLCVPSPCYMSQGKPLNLHWEGGGCFPWVWGRKRVGRTNHVRLKSYSLSALRFLPRASEVYILACTSANRLLRQNMPVLTEALTRQGPNIFLS